MKVLKRPNSVFLQGDIDDVLELFAKNDEVDRLSTFINFFASFHIVCDRYT